MRLVQYIISSRVTETSLHAVFTASHGMFLLPWNTGPRNEKVVTEKTNFATTSLPKSPVTQMSLLNKMKRKRGASGGPERSPVKRRIEHLNHAKLPHLQAVMNAPIHVQQPGEHKPFTYPKTSSETARVNVPGEKLQEISANPPDPALQGNFDGKHQELWKLQGGNSNNKDLPGDKMREQKIQDAENPKPTNEDTDISAMAPLQQMIESQFSLEILLKHRELRLVDQEIAKCQIALEQLRRCQVIPYPVTSSRYEDQQIVSSGSGPSFHDHAQFPPPWGVADGPYTRHYQKWLIPDSAFDGSTAESPHPLRMGGKTMSERTTRGSVAEKSNLGHKSRTQRGSTTARLQALPHGYPEPKEEKGPMIIPRSTDGKMVKLVCLDCKRENFNSAQGFINHCRIAHNRGFASHDAAAQSCGVETDGIPSVGIGVGGGVGVGVYGEASMNGTSVGLVHPLNRSGHVTRPPPANTSFRQRRPQSTAAQIPSQTSGFVANSVSTPVRQSPSYPSGMETPASGSFTPSSQTPHLSALFAKKGESGDLDEMVTDAKTKLDDDADAHLLSDDDDQDMEDAPESAKSPRALNTPGIIRGGRLPARAGMSPAPLERTKSSKGIKNGMRKPEFLNSINPVTSYSSPYTETPTTQAASPNDLASTGLNLSPNTIESHPAPSLVSDDGDYENTHSESEAPSSEEGDEDGGRYLDVSVEDQDEEIGLGGSSSASADLALGKAHPPTARIARRSSTLRGEAPLQDEDFDDGPRRLAVARRRPRRKG